jgi:hypothetical protein
MSVVVVDDAIDMFVGGVVDGAGGNDTGKSGSLEVVGIVRILIFKMCNTILIVFDVNAHWFCFSGFLGVVV